MVSPLGKAMEDGPMEIRSGVSSKTICLTVSGLTFLRTDLGMRVSSGTERCMGRSRITSKWQVVMSDCDSGFGAANEIYENDEQISSEAIVDLSKAFYRL